MRGIQVTIGNKSHLNYQHVFPVVRFDFPINEEDPWNSISIVKVFENEDEATSEAARLNELNGKKGCHYSSTISRLIPKSKQISN